MGFLMGSSCLSPSPPYHPCLLSSYSPSMSSRLRSVGLLSSRNAAAFKPTRLPTASLCRGDEDDAFSEKRRAFLLVGISVLPLLQFEAGAVADTRENKLERQKRNHEWELAAKEEAAPNSFFGLLNSIGIFAAGVLGAVYALAQKEKKAADETIDSLKNQLKNKEAALVSKEKSFEAKLQMEQEEHGKQLKRAKEEQMSLIDQLNSANNTVTGLGQELSNQKRLCEELKVQIESLQNSLSKSGEDKKTLEAQVQERLDLIEVLQERINLLSLELKDKEENAKSISVSLAEKELELKNLNSSYKQTERELQEAKSETGRLKDELSKSQNELDLKNSTLEELNTRLDCTVAEREDYNKKFNDISKDYDALKLTSEKRAALDAELLDKKVHEINQLKKELDHALDELNGAKGKIADLNQEHEDSKRMLDVEMTTVKNLRHELEVMQKMLKTSRDQVSNLETQLGESKTLCSKLESDLSNVQSEFDNAKKRYEENLDEAKQNSEVLSGELAATKELLKKTEDELQMVTRELQDTSEEKNALKRELVDVYKKVETMANELEEEKKKILALKQELEAKEKQISKDKESRRSLETDLEEATRSLAEMNQTTFSLSQELERANAHISGLEDEKETLMKSLTEARDASKEAKENMEDAHNFVMRLGLERDTLEKKVKKLEEDLASAKGEILRLRGQTNSTKVVNSTDEKQQSNATASEKRGGSRRRRNSAGS